MTNFLFLLLPIQFQLTSNLPGKSGNIGQKDTVVDLLLTLEMGIENVVSLGLVIGKE